VTLEYRLEGDIDALDLPPPAPSTHTDGLWQNTCVEAFLRPAGDSPAYCEFNFSPSTAWAAYRFDGYRQGMAALTLKAPPAIQSHHDGQCLTVTVALVLDGALPAANPADWRLGLSAVIKDRQGAISYWALAHPGEKPDFHHADSFVGRLAPGLNSQTHS
jgi:hypothetical protein